MKLKTQQEIFEKHLEEFPDSKRAAEFRLRERLEVIKWIKLLSKCNAMQRTVLAYDFNIKNPKGIANWIKYFFGIKEEEKNG